MEYLAPESLEAAKWLLAQYGEKAKIISGGTDLLLQMKNKEVLPDFLITTGGIAELDYINYGEINGLRIGALATIASIQTSSLIQSKFSILAQAAGTLGTPVIRNRATIMGNLCRAAPSADTAPALVVLGARLRISGVDEEKIVSIDEFFTGPGQTIIRQGQMLTEIQIPNLPPRSGGAYLKQFRGRGAGIAIVGVAALVVMEGDTLTDVKIALGAVAPTPIRAKQAEAILKGKKLNAQLLEEAGRAASRESRPIDDTRSSADYRRKLVMTLVKRAVREAVEQAQLEVR